MEAKDVLERILDEMGYTTLTQVQQNVIADIARDWSHKTNEEVRMMCFSGLAEETGEVMGVAKRRARRLPSDEEKASDKHLAEELGDVLWYLAAVASVCGCNLDKIWEENRAKLRDRYGD